MSKSPISCRLPIPPLRLRAPPVRLPSTDRAVSPQVVCRLGFVPEFSTVQGSPTPSIHPVEPSAVLQQERDGGDHVVLSRQMKRRDTIRLHNVGIGAGIDEKGRQVIALTADSLVQEAGMLPLRRADRAGVL